MLADIFLRTGHCGFGLVLNAVPDHPGDAQHMICKPAADPFRVRQGRNLCQIVFAIAVGVVDGACMESFLFGTPSAFLMLVLSVVSGVLIIIYLIREIPKLSA